MDKEHHNHITRKSPFRGTLLPLVKLCFFFSLFPLQFSHGQTPDIGGGTPIDPEPTPPMTCSIASTSQPFDNDRECYVVEEGEEFAAEFIIESLIANDNFATCTVDFAQAVVIGNGDVLSPESTENLSYTFLLSSTVNVLSLSWTATQSAQTPYKVKMEGNGGLVSIDNCSFPICVDQATSFDPPTCDIRVISSIPHQCAGENINITLSAIDSATTAPGSLQYTFETTCTDGTLDNGSHSYEALLSVSPSVGETCAASVTVTDSQAQSTTCAVALQTPDCLSPPQCPSGSEADSCGVCGFDNSSCLTCETIDITPIQLQSETNIRSATEKIRNRFLQVERRHKKRGLLRSRLANRFEKKHEKLTTLEENAAALIWSPTSLITLCAGTQIDTCAIENYDETVIRSKRTSKQIRKFLKKNTRGFLKRKLVELLMEKGLSSSRAQFKAQRILERTRRPARKALRAAKREFAKIPRQHYSCNPVS